MKFRQNFFNLEEAKIDEVTRSDGKKLTIRQSRFRYFFPDEWMAFYDCLKDRQKITFTFLINLGARISEIRGIRVGDVDNERQSIILKLTKSRNKDGTRKIRVIPVSSEFAKYIRALIKDFNLKNEDSFPILSTPAANIGMKKALIKAGIKDWKNFSVHNVRKTLEGWLLSLGVDSLKVAKHFGHTIAIAEKFYVSSDTFNWEDKQNIRMVIGDLYTK